MSSIHKTAIIHKKAKIGKNVVVGPYSVLDSPGIVLEDNVQIKGHVTIEGNVHVGEGVKIASYASIGAPTTNLSFKGEETFVQIGKGCDIREYVSINSSCGTGTVVKVGDFCLLMPYSFIAHNCTVGDFVIMTNGATLAGHVKIGDYVILGGLCAIAQRLRVGDHAMVGGGSMIQSDIPPFSICSGYPCKIGGLNMVGLKRRKFSSDIQRQLSKAFRITYKMGLRWSEAREQILTTIPQSVHIDNWVTFCSNSEKGIANYRKNKEEKLPEKTFSRS
jgi:UDP-N-acetylglucosamine acyltransferase